MAGGERPAQRPTRQSRRPLRNARWPTRTTASQAGREPDPRGWIQRRALSRARTTRRGARERDRPDSLRQTREKWSRAASPAAPDQAAPVDPRPPSATWRRTRGPPVLIRELAWGTAGRFGQRPPTSRAGRGRRRASAGRVPRLARPNLQRWRPAWVYSLAPEERSRGARARPTMSAVARTRAPSGRSGELTAPTAPECRLAIAGLAMKGSQQLRVRYQAARPTVVRREEAPAAASPPGQRGVGPLPLLTQVSHDPTRPGWEAARPARQRARGRALVAGNLLALVEARLTLLAPNERPG